MKVFIDKNEKKAFRECFKVPYEIQDFTGTGGDIWICRSIGKDENGVIFPEGRSVIIERKTVSDYISSSFTDKTKRKKRQIYQLQQLRTKWNSEVYFLIEGNLFIKQYAKYHKAIQQGLTNLRIRDRIGVIVTKNKEDTCAEVGRICKSLDVGGGGSCESYSDEYMMKCHTRVATKVGYLKSMLNNVPGIGKKTAESILTEGKIRNVVELLRYVKGDCQKSDSGYRPNSKQRANLKKFLL